jgi:hypothetical protein
VNAFDRKIQAGWGFGVGFEAGAGVCARTGAAMRRVRYPERRKVESFINRLLETLRVYMETALRL